MTVLKHQYDNQDDIPEEYRGIYSEKAGKWEPTGISGIRTQADVDRLQSALDKEKNDHKQVREKLAAWGDLGEVDDVHKKLDRIPELEAAAKGKLDENEIETIVQKRVEGTIRSQLLPVERQLKKVTTERDDLLSKNQDFVKKENQRLIHDAADRAGGPEGEKLEPGAIYDFRDFAEKVMHVGEDGTPVTKEGVGVTPGIGAKELLAEMRPKRPHWWPGSVGTGSAGSGPRAGVGAGPDNPWSHAGWNMHKQGLYFKEHGMEKAQEMAKMAGTTFPGGQRPAPKKK